tara:strand:- start:995 stop:1249 length:255 start_codon:yes stop_codon:yes gene_type:complete
MPTYSFRDNNTGEVEDKFMSISRSEEYLQENPHMVKIIRHAPVFSYSTGSDGNILKKAGEGWKEVQQRIQGGLPPSLRDKIKTK